VRRDTGGGGHIIELVEVTDMGKEFWATVRVALESDAKTARLCAILLVAAAVSAIIAML
jgi:hypothetical protein